MRRLLSPDPSKNSRWVWTICPNTGEEVIGGSWDKGVIVISSLFGWYHCPSCGGWHVKRSDPDGKLH